MPETSTPILMFITMSPSFTPGTAMVFVSPTPSAKDEAFSVATTDQVSEKRPRNWSVPLRETTAVAAAIINLLDVKNPPTD
jgi:hypothetical protein